MSTITKNMAQAQLLPGWNIRCNRCGNYGARWLRNLRPDFGSYAACPKDETAILHEQARHLQAMKELTPINHEQDDRTSRQGLVTT